MSPAEKETRKKELLDELEKLETTSTVVKAADYSVEEKIAYFDTLHQMALDHLTEIEAGREDDDDEHYMYEAVVVMLNLKNQKSVWEYINQLLVK
jgi:hypothetical protein